jgi:tetraacyldisaccharide 4'-kinase
LSPPVEHYVRRVMSGQQTGLRASALRVAMAAAALPYGLASSMRNRIFDAGFRKMGRLPRPVISVGNITSGGTGKTPVIRWLAEQLRSAGQTVAILSRGYRAQPGFLGDEQRMLSELLNRPGQHAVHIGADPNRFRGGNDLLREHPDINVVLLDDGFQHRQLARDFDLVLVNAAEPFGFGHVLPRGMLREPLRGLNRANAFLLTRCDHVSEAQLKLIRQRLRRHNPAAPIFQSVHTNVGPAATGLAGRRWFLFCGIGDPESFVRQLTTVAGSAPAGQRLFPDHHAYTSDDIRALRSEAVSVGADVLVTTQKDWVKLAALPETREAGPAIWPVDVEIHFPGDDEAQLLAAINVAIAAARSASVAV